MSMSLTAKAMSLKVGNAIRKLVLLKLADQANDRGNAGLPMLPWPRRRSVRAGR
ncbi:hypothetical protein [Kingella potus]|uniref:hypothetical protein n=1 Tax=Kingella potus TaxID=265175 RepID=UPI001FD4E1ED|nr:hypothetical protein [Kingella potus]UOP00551.1 hypothetical protein LVJ84_12035 [Kingella potus]UOP01995.1 hypothetical protein LVJ84_14570 [Kingella potus]